MYIGRQIVVHCHSPYYITLDCLETGLKEMQFAAIHFAGDTQNICNVLIECLQDTTVTAFTDRYWDLRWKDCYKQLTLFQGHAESVYSDTWRDGL